MITLHNKETAFENFSNLLNQIINDLEKTGNQITKENIHIYYEYMNSETTEEYSEILDAIFDKRAYEIMELLELEKDNFYSNCKFITPHDMDLDSIIGLIVFGVKDILKPLGNYIDEIKDSKNYKIFISES